MVILSAAVRFGFLLSAGSESAGSRRTSGRARAVSGLYVSGPVAEEGTDIGDFLVADAVRETGVDASVRVEWAVSH